MSNSYEVKGKWSISRWNYCNELTSQLNLQPKIEIHDQTLRDGTQFSGIEFSDDEKVEIAARLDQIGVQRIEAGRISSDPAHLKVVKRITALKRTARVLGFVELSTELIKRAADCGVEGVVLCFPSNEKAITEKMKSTVREVTELAQKMVETANALNQKVILFPTDAGRATPDSYRKMMTEVLKAGRVDALTFVDTVGGCSPLAIPHIIRFLRTVTDLPLEVHCHNDFGLAAANTIAALACGVSTAHTTVLGIGERCGNAHFEQVVMILRTMYGLDLGIKLDKLNDLCHYVASASALPIPANQPVVGGRIYEIECLENLLGYYKVPQDVAVKYTFPYHWNLVGHAPQDFAMGAESTPEVFDILLDVLGKNSIAPEARKRILAEIQEKAVKEKRSLPRKEILSMLAGVK